MRHPSTVQGAAARWLFTVGDDTPERFLEAKSLVYQYAYDGALKRHTSVYGRTRASSADVYHARTQAEALRLHDTEMKQLAREHPRLFMTIEHRPGELMVVPPGAAHAVVNLRCGAYITFTSVQAFLGLFFGCQIEHAVVNLR